MVLVANHASHLDTPTILRALPRCMAAADRSSRRPPITSTSAGRRASGVSLLLNTVPVARSGGGADALEHVAELVGDGWNLLIYAEGTRSRDGSLGRMRSGAALVAQRHGIPIVPVRVTGTHAAMPPDASWPRRGCGDGCSAAGTGSRSSSENRSWRSTSETPAETMARVSTFFTDEHSVG